MSGSWIRKNRRKAIYYRDMYQCVWCGCLVIDQWLTLDHLKPVSKGGNNKSSNLITACKECNSKRGNISVIDFVKKIAKNKKEEIEILNRINRNKRKKLKR